MHTVVLMTKVHSCIGSKGSYCNIDINGVFPQDAELASLQPGQMGNYRSCQVHTTESIIEIHIIFLSFAMVVYSAPQSESVSAVQHVCPLPPPGDVPLPLDQPGVDWSSSRAHCRINMWQEKYGHMLSTLTNNTLYRLN